MWAYWYWGFPALVFIDGELLVCFDGIRYQSLTSPQVSIRWFKVFLNWTFRTRVLTWYLGFSFSLVLHLADVPVSVLEIFSLSFHWLVTSGAFRWHPFAIVDIASGSHSMVIPRKSQRLSSSKTSMPISAGKKKMKLFSHSWRFLVSVFQQLNNINRRPSQPISFFFG